MPQHLIEGLRRFRTETFPRYRERYRRLVEDGQRPTTLFIGCADSRVVPGLLTRTDPGELFIVRNLGGFVPPCGPDRADHGTASAIEYAVLVLGVTDIAICGHSHCGAVEALYAAASPNTPHLTHWLELGHGAMTEGWTSQADGAGVAGCRDSPDRHTLFRTEQRSVALQLDRLMTYPFVADRVGAGTLSLHGWHYILEDGRVLALDVEAEAFLPLEGDPGD